MSNISHTAAYIAIKFYGLTKDLKIARQFDPFVLKFYEKTVGFLPNHLSWYQNSLNSEALRKFFIWSEELLLPGDLMHIICRKYYINKLVHKAIKEGIEQLVIMGAGFDHLGAFASSQGILSFELDTESMISEKKKFTIQNEFQSELLHFNSIDFERLSLAGVLGQSDHFDPTKKTLFIAEGFFDYLSLQTTKEILLDIKALNTQNQLLTTFFSLDELKWFHRFSFTSGVSLVGESLKLPLNRSQFIEVLNEYGFSVDREISYSEMEQDLVSSMETNLPVLKGFYILGFVIR